MSENIADLGFSVDTSDLKDAVTALDAIVPAADKVEKKVSKTSKQFDGLNSAAEKLSMAAAGLSAAADKLSAALDRENTSLAAVAAGQNATSAATNKAAAATTAAAAAAGQAAASNKKNAASLDELRAKYNPVYAVIRKYLENVKEIRAAQVSGALSMDEMTEAIKRQRTAALQAISAIKTTAPAHVAMGKSSNLAAHEVLNLSRQLADIGVTAAMGMNPLMILIQQGPQIADVFASAASRGVKFEQAMKALLLQLGLVRVVNTQVAVSTAAAAAANTAAAATAVELAAANTAAAGSATALATAETVALAPLALILAAIVAALALFTSGFALAARDVNKHTGDIAKGMNLTEKQMERLKEKGIDTGVTLSDTFKAFFVTLWESVDQIFKPAIDFMGKLWNGLLDGMTKAFVFSLRVLIATMMTLGQSAKYIFTRIPGIIGDAFVTGMQYAMNAIVDLANFTVDAVNKLGFKLEKLQKVTISNPFKGTIGNIGGDLAGIQAQAWVDAGKGLDSFAAAWERNAKKIAQARIAAGAGKPDKEKIAKTAQARIAAGAGKPDKEKIAKTAQEKKDPLAEVMKTADADIAALKAETAQVGLYGRELAYAAAQAKLLAEAKSKGMTDAQIAAAMPQINDKAGQIASAQVELDRKRFLEGQNQAYEKANRELAMQKEMLGMTADEALRYQLYMSAVNEALDQHIILTDGDRQAIKSQTDEIARGENELRKMREQLEFAKTTAKGFFSDMKSNLQSGQTLWQAFANAVIKALDKIIDRMADKAIDDLFAGMSSSKGGSVGNNPIASAWDWLMNANGNAFTSKGVKAYAKGDSFTNSVVDRATMFAYGGSNLGIMGEKGPEAILPLKRGSDGSLGVQMQASAAAAVQNSSRTNNVDVHNTYVLQGAMTSNDIIALTRQAAEQTKQSVKESLVGWLDQSQRDGTIV